MTAGLLKDFIEHCDSARGGILCAIPNAYLQNSSLKEHLVKLVSKHTHTQNKTKNTFWKTQLQDTDFVLFPILKC